MNRIGVDMLPRSVRPSARWAMSLALTAALVVAGCRSAGSARAGADSDGRSAPRGKPVVRRVVCLYDQKPWLNLDLAGDRDPEGVWFRVFLDPGSGKGVHVDGTFHVEMFQITPKPEGGIDRTLVGDWHYLTKEISTIAKPGMLGEGYVLQLRFASKRVAGSEVEVITRFEDRKGNSVRGGTKRLRIPKYES